MGANNNRILSAKHIRPVRSIIHRSNKINKIIIKNQNSFTTILPMPQWTTQRNELGVIKKRKPTLAWDFYNLPIKKGMQKTTTTVACSWLSRSGRPKMKKCLRSTFSEDSAQMRIALPPTQTPLPPLSWKKNNGLKRFWCRQTPRQLRLS